MQQSPAYSHADQPQVQSTSTHQDTATIINWQAAWQAAAGMWKNHDELTSITTQYRQQWNQRFHDAGK